MWKGAKNMFKTKKRVSDKQKDTEMMYKIFDVDVTASKYNPSKARAGISTKVTHGEHWMNRCVVEIKKYPKANQAEIQERAQKILTEKILLEAHRAGEEWLRMPLQP